MNYKINSDELPQWFNYPAEFERLIEQNLVDLDPWTIMAHDSLKVRFSGLKERYPNRSLVPFARRWDNDVLACWEDENSIVVINDFETAGSEDYLKFESLWDWFRHAVEDMIEYEPAN